MRRWSTVVVSVLAGALALSALTACEPEGIYVRAVYDVDRYDDIAYATETDEHGQPEELRFDLYAPRDGERKNRPSVVWAHGGSFTSGDKSSMRWIPEALAARGFVVISINYRLRVPVAHGRGDCLPPIAPRRLQLHDRLVLGLGPIARRRGGTL